MGHARARKIPAQLVEDEEYQLRHERVAGIDVAKAKADVCTRLPPARDGGRRASRVEEVPARAADTGALAERLLAGGVELVRDRTREWQRLEKLLEGALVKLSSAVWSLALSKTARAILEATAAGESDPLVLAALASAQVRGGRAAIAQALAGMQVRGHHRMLIRVHLDHVTFLDRQVTAVEDEIAAAPDAIPAAATSTS